MSSQRSGGPERLRPALSAALSAGAASAGTDGGAALRIVAAKRERTHGDHEDAGVSGPGGSVKSEYGMEWKA